MSKTTMSKLITTLGGLICIGLLTYGVIGFTTILFMPHGNSPLWGIANLIFTLVTLVLLMTICFGIWGLYTILANKVIIKDTSLENDSGESGRE